MKTDMKASYKSGNKHHRASGMGAQHMNAGGTRPGTQTPVGSIITGCAHGPSADLALDNAQARGGYAVKSPTKGTPPGGRRAGARKSR